MTKRPQSEVEINLLHERTMALIRMGGRDLSLRQLSVLLVCDATEEMQTVRGLAQNLNISRPAVTRAVDRLESANLAARLPDSSDGRSVWIVATPLGHRYCVQFFGRKLLNRTAPKMDKPSKDASRSNRAKQESGE